MCCRIIEMKAKAVVSIKSGCVLGTICDVIIDTSCGKIVSIVVCRRLKCFGIFGREEIIVKWESIEVIGKDTILVNCEPDNREKGKFFKNFFNRSYENQF